MTDEIRQLVLRMLCENFSRRYDRIAGVVHKLPYTISDQPMGQTLQILWIGFDRRVLDRWIQVSFSRK